MDSTIRGLLQQVKLVTKYYSQLSTQSGEGFNLFKVINMTHNETSVHSRFIAELLNPKGSHGQGDAFLKIFTELFCRNLNFDYSTVNTKVEKSIGPKDLDTGGRLDIIVSDGKSHCIVIENKINASDQEKQLIRYNNYAKSHKESQLIYLTLYGNNPSEYSIKSEDQELKRDNDYICLSYKSDILEWLKNCRKEVVTFPILREGITHYINLIKLITNQSTNEKMEKEVTKIILNSFEDFQAANLIAANVYKAGAEIQLLFWKELRESLINSSLEPIDNEEKFERDIKSKISNYYEKNANTRPGIWIKIYQKDNITIHWGAEVESFFYTGFTLEINGEGGVSNTKEAESYRKLISEMGEFDTSSRWWLGWKNYSPELNFSTINENVYNLTKADYLKEIVESITKNAAFDIKSFKASLEEGF